MEQVTRELSDEMADRIEAQRDWVRNHYAPESVNEYDTVDGKLVLLNEILKSGWIEKDETYKLQCLGITLGDIIVQDLGFHWIEVEDDYGLDPAITLTETSIFLFPLTMISKRIEEDEIIEIFEFYEAVKRMVDGLKHQE